MKVRYRFAAGLVAAVMGAASAGSTVYASTFNGGSGSSHSSSSSRSTSNSDRNRGEFRRDRGGDRSFRDDRSRNHCCDSNHNNDNHNNDNHSSDSSSRDCDWLRNHDHDAWLKDCR